MSTPDRPSMLAKTLDEEWGRDHALAVDELLEIAQSEGTRMLAAVAVRLAARLGYEESRLLATLIEARMT